MRQVRRLLLVAALGMVAALPGVARSQLVSHAAASPPRSTTVIVHITYSGSATATETIGGAEETATATWSETFDVRLDDLEHLATAPGQIGQVTDANSDSAQFTASADSQAAGGVTNCQGAVTQAPAESAPLLELGQPVNGAWQFVATAANTALIGCDPGLLGHTAGPPLSPVSTLLGGILPAQFAFMPSDWTQGPATKQLPVSFSTTADCGSTPGAPCSESVSWQGTIKLSANPGPYVALGDSYSAGDGAVPPSATERDAYLNNCHRTKDAFPELVGLAVDNLACSGAKINSIEYSQLPSIPADAALVTITAGGNDVGLFARSRECFLTPLARLVLLRSLLRRHGCGAELARETASELSGLPERLSKLYLAIHRRAPEAEVLVLAYPNPFPPTLSGACAARPQGAVHHLPVRLLATLYSDDIPPFFSMIAALNDAVSRGVALATGSGFAPAFLPTNGAGIPDQLSFDGHDICGSSPWLWGLRVSPYPPSSSLHPNIAGNEALAQYVADYARGAGLL